MTIWLLTLLLSLIYTIIYFKKSSKYWKRRNVVGPMPIPIFGNIKASVLRQKNLATIYKEIYNNFPHEKVVGIYTMTSPALLIRDLEIVKRILVKDFDSFSERGLKISKEKLGDNLFHCDSKTWKALKGKLTPFFSTSKIKSSFNDISDCGDKFVEYIDEVSLNKSDYELHNLFRKFGIDATLTGIFNLKIDTYKGNVDFLEKLDKSIFRKSYLSDVSMFFTDFMNITNTSLFGETAVKFCYDIVKNAKTRDDISVTNNVIDMLIDLKNDDDSSDKCMKNEHDTFKVTDGVIASQAFILYAASYENTSLSLSYAFYYLANNIDIQDKLIEEIDNSIKKTNGKLTYEALNEMTYLEKVFKETVRMQPLSNTLQRVAIENYILPGTDIVIDKGTTVLISSLAIHQDEKYYAEPLKFDPERFNQENLRKRDACAFLTFGLGPRSCFGFRFTKMLFKVATVKILSKYVVRPSEKTKNRGIDPNRMMLAMKGGIHVRILPRNNNKN